MLKPYHYTLLFYFIFWSPIKAQDSAVHELGILIGPSLLLSDYGQRSNLTSSFNNAGLSMGIAHYLSFNETSLKINFFKIHFKIRSELSYTRTILNHYSDWIKNNPTSQDAQQLKAMETKTSILNLGSQLEYFPFSEVYNMTDTPYKFSPYVSLGLLYSFYAPKTSSSLGKLGTEDVTFPKYLVPSDGHKYGFTSEKSSCWSVVSSLGTRYKLFNDDELIIEARIQWFNSDWIDGLNISKKVYTENRSNDWQFWLNFGYVFQL